MKKVYFFFYLFAFLAFELNAQAQGKPDSCCCGTSNYISCKEPYHTVTTTENITLDFKTKNIAFPKDLYKLKRGNAIRIRVVNYNPFLYNVVINSTDSNSYAVTDANNLLGWFLNPANLSGVVANISKALPVGLSQGKNALDAGEEKTVFVATQTGKFDKFLSANPSTQNKMIKADPELLKLSRDKDTLQVRDSLNKQRKIVIDFNDTISILEDKIQDSLYEWSKWLRIKEKINVNCKNLKVPDDFDIVHIEEMLKFFRDTLHKLSARALDMEEEYSEKFAKDPYARLIKNTPDSIPDAYIKKFYTKAIDQLHSIDSSLSYKNQQIVINTLTQMQDRTSCFTSFPVYLMADIKPVNITIKPWKDSSPLQSYSTSFAVPWSQTQIWGVTAGIYFSGLYNDVYVPKQLPVPDTTKYNLIKDNNGKIEYGINALAYTARKWNRKSNNYAYTGIAFGAGISIASKYKPRILLGWTNVFGNSNRVMVTAGIMGGSVERLSNAYNVDQPILGKPDSVVKDVFKTSGFISINYSFLSK